VKKDISDVGAKNDVSFNSATSLPEYDMLLAYLKLPADPDQYAFWHSSQVAQNNISNFKSVKIDKVLEDGRNTADRDERQKIYYQFQRIMVDEVPAVFLYYPYSYTIKRKSLL
jgi:peptide/nickel transport system substrate-binding protein